MLGRATKILLPGILLCLIGVYRVAEPPGAGAKSDLAALPREILGLSSVDIPVEQAIVDDLDPDDLLIRRYMRPDGIPVWVVLIYFVNTRLGGHNPQLCYRSQGYRTRDLPEERIESAIGPITAEAFLATRGMRSERVATVWYTSGEGAISDVSRYRRRLFYRGCARTVSMASSCGYQRSNRNAPGKRGRGTRGSLRKSSGTCHASFTSRGGCRDATDQSAPVVLD